jgi:transcriptional regulator with XRE-family HTH domain
MEIGHHLKKARESKRMSQQEVAELLGISQKSLSNMESNKTQPSIVQIAEMGKIYDLEMTRPELSLHKVNYNETTKRKKNKEHRISELG